MVKMKLLTLLLMAVFACGCAEKGCTDPEALNYKKSAERDDESCQYGDKYIEQKKSLIRNHAALASALYTDALLLSNDLKTKVDTFVNNPSDDGLSEVKLAWRNAYFAYLQCDGLRFSRGPIDDDRELSRILGQWPINPSLIDYTTGETGGLISDTTSLPVISAEAIEALNQGVNKNQTTIGFHSIEYLLWGQDDEDVSLFTTGNRPFSDFDKNDSTTTNAKRRGEYLSAAAALLVNHLGVVVSEWDSLKTKNYRKTFLDLEENIALKNILTGLGTLTKSEFGIRALQEPVASGSQEDEISNYSDNTATDLAAMAYSIEIIYRGTYTPQSGFEVKGKSIDDLITEANPELAEQVDKKLDEVIELVGAIPSPFDWQASQEFEFGEGPITDAANALIELEGLLKEVAREFEIGIETDLP
jgi:putative iron-regulated protein